MSKLLSLLGLTRRAGKVVMGYTATNNAVSKGLVYLVVISNDLSENSKEKVSRLCKQHKVEIISFCDRFCLGQALGKQEQAITGVTSKELAGAIMTAFSSTE